ncbi:MAG: Crp/Fnr family transcriptional regulator [Aerococcus sp.]|nr:Crp/Fnr family transcriptional regulator [Aerococcus sp.]
MAHDHRACIRLVPIFNHLTDEQMDMIATSAHPKHLAKHELLFRMGEKDDTLYIVNSGKIRIYQLSESGREQTIRLLNPGDFTGEVAIFQPESFHTSYAEATMDSSICILNKNDLDRYLTAYPEITRRILATVTQRLQTLETHTTQVVNERVEARIISFLAENVASSDNHTMVTLPMSKKDLASYLGTTPETLSRKFTTLEEQGLIKQHPKNQIEIMDLDELLFALN